MNQVMRPTWAGSLWPAAGVDGAPASASVASSSGASPAGLSPSASSVSPVAGLPSAAVGLSRQSGMRFASLILLLVLLFLRPGDIFPALEQAPIYLFALLGATALCLPLITRQLHPAALRRSPITCCVLGLFFVGIASNAVHGDLYDTRLVAKDFLSILLLYLMVAGATDTPQRLRRLLKWTTVLIIMQAVLGLMQYQGWIDVGAGPYVETQDDLDPLTKMPIVLARLCGTGIFNNPNEVSRILVVGGLLCLYFLTDRTQRGLRRFLWAVPLALMAIALQLTYSRGGFLALLAGLAVLTVGRFGRVRSIVVAALLVPLMLVALSNRITDIDTTQGTGQERIQIWRDAFEEMKTAPVLGIGVYQLAEEIGLVAHNSFVQCYVEMGVVGGVLFTGAFYLAFWMPYRIGPQAGSIADAELRRLRVYLLAIVAGVVVGMFSSTRCYRLETYLLLGIVAAYLRLVGPQLSGPMVRVNAKLLLRIAVVGGVGLIAFFFTPSVRTVSGREA